MSGTTSTHALASADGRAKSPRELRAEVESALRRSVGAGDSDAAARELLGLYQELRDDRLMAPSVRAQFGRTVRGRLQRLAADLARVNGAAPILAQQLGGPALGGQPGAGNGARQPDHGQALVELIQTVVAPDIWDVNGGPATVVYFAPKMALVVRAPGEVHAELGALLPQLRP